MELMRIYFSSYRCMEIKKKRVGNTRGLVPVWIEPELSGQIALLSKEKKVPKGKIIASAMKVFLQVIQHE